MDDIIAKANKEFNVLSVGNYQSVCFDVWDIGLQKGEYKGETIITHKIIIGWETDERIVSADTYNGQRYRIYKFYTLSLGKKSNLFRDLTSWRSKEFTKEELDGFSMKKLIGVNCMLNIIHGDDGKAKISAVTSMPKGLMPLVPENKQGLPDWVKKFKDKALSEEDAEILAAEKSTADDSDTPVPY